MTNTAKTPHPVTAGHSERNISFDLIRILAIFLVMYNHRETYIFYHHVPHMGLRYILSMCGAAFCKCGPPLFFMVSGALILHKKESFRRIFQHRILRILIVMVILSILIVTLIPDSDSFLKTFFSGLNWYLYAYIGYLLMLPFLRILVNHMTRKDMRLFFILTAIAYSVSGILIPSHFQFTLRKQLLEPGISGTCLLSGQFFQTRRKPGPKKADSSDTSDRYHRQPGHRHASDEL